MKLRPGPTMSHSRFFFFFTFPVFVVVVVFSFFKADLPCSVIARSLIIITQLRLLLFFLSDIPMAFSFAC